MMIVFHQLHGAKILLGFLHRFQIVEMLLLIKFLNQKNIKFYYDIKY